jgi:hypothetical protein
MRVRPDRAKSRFGLIIYTGAAAAGIGYLFAGEGVATLYVACLISALAAWVFPARMRPWPLVPTMIATAVFAIYLASEGLFAGSDVPVGHVMLAGVIAVGGIFVIDAAW